MSRRRPIVPESARSSYDRFHFAPAMQVDDTIWCSGVIGTDDAGAVPSRRTDEFRNAFRALADTLAEAGASLADVVELTTFHTDLPDGMGDFLAVKDEFVAAPYPAWTAIGCTGLAIPGARVEIKAVAVVDR